MPHDHKHHSNDPHDHGHDHSHDHAVSNLSLAFFVAIAVNAAFTLTEWYFGWSIHSLALISDAGHNAMDTLNLVLSGIALWISQFKNTGTYTYGYKRAGMLAALVNSILLLGTAIYLAIEAIERFQNPVETVGTTIMTVAGIGILVNGLSSFLLLRWAEHDINVKSAYMHLLGDALVSFGVVVAGVAIYFTGYSWIDPAISILVSILMVWGTIGILKKSIRMNFDGVPLHISINKIQEIILSVAGVKDVHHIHVWSISTTQNAMTAHVIISDDADTKKIKHHIRHELLHEGIHHVTLETENERCEGGC